jgi:hypothetical protein
MKKLIKKKAVEVKEEIIKDEFGRIVLSDKKADLLEEACTLNLLKKKAEDRLKEIKTELGLTEKGVYINSKNNQLTISLSVNKSDVEPQTIYKKFHKLKQLDNFWNCVKVSITELGKYLPKDEIDGLRTELEPTVRYSYK